jgi:hypothetical protein
MQKSIEVIRYSFLELWVEVLLGFTLSRSYVGKLLAWISETL